MHLVYYCRFSARLRAELSLGFLQQVNNKTTSAKLWEAKAFNGEGQLEAFQLGVEQRANNKARVKAITLVYGLKSLKPIPPRACSCCGCISDSTVRKVERGLE